MKKSQHRIFLLVQIVIITFTFFALSAIAQLERSKAEDQAFFSNILPPSAATHWLVRYRVILPKSYRPEEIHSVVYFLHGRNGNRFNLESLGVLDQLDRLADNNFKSLKGKINFIIVQPECDNCYWMNAALKNERWGDVISQELIRDVEQKYFIEAKPAGRLLAGISMGGHGAIQLTLNNPNVFGVTAAHSPVFRTQEEASRDFPQQFGYGEDYQNRDPFSLIKFKQKHITGAIWMDIGASDPFFYNTNNFAQLLQQVGYQGELHIGEDSIGGHQGGYWSYHLYNYLEWYQNHLKF